MNKAELIEYVAKRTKSTKRGAEEAVNATLEGIKKNVKKGGVQLVGFGSFTVVSRKGRMGRNPQTQAEQVSEVPSGKRLQVYGVEVRFRLTAEYGALPYSAVFLLGLPRSGAVLRGDGWFTQRP